MKIADLFFSFQGRAARRHWWAVQAVLLAVTLPLVVLLDRIANQSIAGGTALAWLGFALGMLVPITWVNFAITVKRFHDRGKNGAWSMIVLAPYVGALWALVECGFLGGDAHENAYGAPV